MIDRARRQYEQDGNDDCEVWRENWRSVMFYLTVSTQWIIVPMGGYVGLNYIAVESAMNMAHVMKYKRRTLFSDLQLIEHTMLPILNKRK